MQSMIWNRDYESLPRRDLEQHQLERLQVTLNRAYRNVAFYRRLFDRIGFQPDEVGSLGDLSRIPFTTRQDLHDNQPYDMFAIPLREVVRLQSSSGTTGDPIVTGYTQTDVRHWTELVSRVLTSAEITKEDVVQISFGYGLFTGAIGFDYGVQNIGATVIPSSRVNMERQIEIMKNYRTTVLVCTPGFALQIADTVERLSVPAAELSLRVGLFGAEPWSEAQRRRIESVLHVTALDNYGLSEIIGPGVSSECPLKCGLHLHEDHFIAEVIDPETGDRLPDCEKGELVLTTITKEATPLIRYRTGDLTSLNRDPCNCGRILARMARVMERTDDMVVVEGLNVYPSHICELLSEVLGLQPQISLGSDPEHTPNGLLVSVEMSESLVSDKVRRLTELEERMRNRLSQELDLAVRVRFVEPGGRE